MAVAGPPGAPGADAGAAPARLAARPFTVSEVLGQVKECLEGSFLPLLVVGEVADLRQPRGGHLYFSLRDARAQLRVVVFAGELARMGRPALKDGDEAIVGGRLTAYPGSSSVQIVASRLEPVGLGALLARREALRRRLDAEGLFSPARKRPLPFLPRAVGLVTSPTGAAIRDVLTTIERRFPRVRVVIAGVRVNGAAAGAEVAARLLDLDRRGGVDVILLVRGGGSAEDLAAFDQEEVVRAIAACRAPVVCGVGHETDVTLADHVADRRAATPTAAAELIFPTPLAELEAELARRGRRLREAVTQRLRLAGQRLQGAARSKALQAPRDRVQFFQARLAACEHRLAAASPAARTAARRADLERAAARLAQAAARQAEARARDVAEAARRLERAHPGGALAARAALVERAAARLARLDPRPALAARAAALDERERRLAQAALLAPARGRTALAAAAARLEGLSPLAVLARGYSVTFDPAGKVARDAGALAPGDALTTRLARGTVRSRVEAIEPGPEG